MALGTQIYLYDPATDGFTELTAEIGAGFGDAANKYAWSIYMWDGDGDGVEELYVGTWNAKPDLAGAIGFGIRSLFVEGGDVPLDGPGLEDLMSPIKSNGGQIWKYDFTSESWDVSLDASHPDLSTGDVGFREIIEYDGKLYATTARPGNVSQETVKMFVSEDGETWTQIEGGAMDPALGHNSVRTMKVVDDGNGNDVLMMATSNYASDSQIWTYSSDGTWTHVANNDNATISDIFVDESDGAVYVTTWTDYHLYKVDMEETDPDASLTDVTPIFDLDTGRSYDQGIIEITYFDGWYYIGSANYGGSSLIRSQDLDDPDSWEVITTDGFYTYGEDQSEVALEAELQAIGHNRMEYTWQMYELDGYLYIGTFSGGQAGLLRLPAGSEDGRDWELVEEADFEDEAYGVRTMIPVALDENGVPMDGDANMMILGTANYYAAFVGDQLVPDIRDWYLGRLGDDTVTGDFGDNVILGLAGDDLLEGTAGDDFMAGDAGAPMQAGNDELHGGFGDDVIGGNRGNDLLYGDAGEDMVIGGFGSDILYGGEGNDLLIGDFAVDQLVETMLSLYGIPWPPGVAAGNPSLAFFEVMYTWREDLKDIAREALGEDAYNRLMDATGANDDIMYGGNGSDIGSGGEGRDKFYGGNGSDIGFGGTGADLLFGNSGDDFLFGEQGNDRLRGGVGDDMMQGGAGNDHYWGGDGADVFNMSDVSVERHNAQNAPEDWLPIVTGRDRIYDFEDGVDVIDLGAIAIDPTTFADDLDNAVSRFGFRNTLIDLDELGGDGSILLVGVRASEIDVSDFTSYYLV